MKKYTYIIMTILYALCLSCNGPFDMKLADEPIICLEAYPGLDDMIELSITPAYSKSNSALKPEFKPQIRFTVNGQELPAVLNKDYCISEKYNSESYLVDYKAVPGDKMTIEVSSEGFSPIYAQTSIPERFPERRIAYEELEIGDDKYKMLLVSLEDDVHTDIAYGVSLFSETTQSDSYNQIDTTYFGWTGGFQIRDDYDIAPTSMEGMTFRIRKWDKSLRHTYMEFSGWDDDSFSGKQKTLSIALYYDPFGSSYSEPIYDEDNVLVGFYEAVSRSKLLLYTFSEEFIKYQVAQTLGGENAGFFAGIAPSNFCYTNVENGYGVFAGVWSEQTDWITPEFFENNR